MRETRSSSLFLGPASYLAAVAHGSADLEFHRRGRVFCLPPSSLLFGFLNPPLDVRWHNEVSRHSAVAHDAPMISIEWHTAGTMRLTLCIGRYALKLPRGVLGRVANYGERVEWKRATLERR